jgi:hypothetical protein
MDKSVEATRPDSLPDLALQASLHRAMSQAGSQLSPVLGSSRSGRETDLMRKSREYSETMSVISASVKNGQSADGASTARSSTALFKMKKKKKGGFKV